MLAIVVYRMSCSNRCTLPDSQYSYTIYQDRLTFKQAELHCQRQNGTLAQIVDEQNYLALKKCCGYEQDSWIGLVKDKTCLTNRKHQYRWVSSSNCMEKPKHLKYTDQPNNTGCQGITIKFTSIAQDTPKARITNCIEDQQYICQFEHTQKDTPIVTHRPTEILPTATVKTEAIAGAISGVVLVLLFLICCAIWNTKKQGAKKFPWSKHISNLSISVPVKSGPSSPDNYSHIR